MKKKIIILTIIVVILILVIPLPTHLKDGGTIEYRALLYKISKVHSLASLGNAEEKSTYNDGIIVEILGFEVFNNVNYNEIANKQGSENDNNDYKEYSKKIDNVEIKMDIPNDWKYEEMEKNEANDFFKYALKLYKSDSGKYTTLYLYNNAFGVCGTLRTSKELMLKSGEKAVIGYYDGNENWNDISFYSINPNIAIINNGLTNDEADEVINFVKTIQIL